jgi:hypothetical protein
MQKYTKEDVEQIRSDWSLGQDVRLPEPEDIIEYWYEDPDGYSGSAFGLFVMDGKLYEVHGGHCSCYGLEDQWEPEETTWEALLMRKPQYGSPFSGNDAHFADLKQEWEASRAG